MRKRPSGAEPARRRQSHVGIAPATAAAEDGRLFTGELLETLERTGAGPALEWGIACAFEGARSRTVERLALGGDRRPARIEAADALFAPPATLLKAIPDRGVPGLRLIVITPAVFRAGWLPDGFTARADRSWRATNLLGFAGELILRAALLGRADAVSGWDMAAGQPKPTRRLVRPGSVFHLVRGNGTAFSRADVQRLWLAAIGFLTEQGFGRVVAAPWYPQGAPP